MEVSAELCSLSQHHRLQSCSTGLGMEGQAPAQQPNTAGIPQTIGVPPGPEAQSGRCSLVEEGSVQGKLGSREGDTMQGP